MPDDSYYWEKQYSSGKNIWAGIVDLPRLTTGLRVLEAGCGNGKTLLSMQNRGWEICAFDFSKTAAQLAKKSLLSGMSGEVLCGDSSRLMFKDESFDVVFARHVIGHSFKEKRHEICKELSRVLKCGGTLYFSEFEVLDMKACGDDSDEENTYRKKNGIITHFFSENEVLSLFCDTCGLECKTLDVHRWDLKVRGTAFPRAEINGVFVRT